MKIYLTLLRKELAAFFCSLTGYVIIATVTLLTGASFLMLIRNLGSDPFLLPVTELFFNSLLFWIIIVLVTPVITMRLFALEKASGTFETLMTTPVGDLAVVAAKFTAAMSFYLIMWLPTIACLFIVGHFTNQTGALDSGTPERRTCVGNSGSSGAFFISLGCFASSLTRSQVVAAMLEPGRRRHPDHRCLRRPNCPIPPTGRPSCCCSISISSNRWKTLPEGRVWTRAR